MILVIDNYDSFTYNLVQLLAPFGDTAKVIRNDAMSARDALALRPQAIIISPGPCDPDQAGMCLDLVGAAKDAKIPLFGVCLGHQAIAQAHGANIIRAQVPMHGKVSEMIAKPDPLFQGIGPRFMATRYHSLTIDPASVPDTIDVLATSVDDKEIMALKVIGHPLYGVQFHPESYLSDGGGQLLANFLHAAGMKEAA